ncbi:MAG: hypothetical protein NPIRA02_14040 [Nitrospirales bacterium]|nr:MAG: hypothetical protein NPIRA02_14040 [Nitrospirales bacterium]
MSKNSLATILTAKHLRTLAEDRFFERGQDYFEHGQVARLTESNGVIHASVHGSKPYTVKLWEEQSALGYRCTCPVGADGELCKHCVAVGLAWEDKQTANQATSSQSKQSGTQKITLDDVRTYLGSKKKSTLIDLIMERVDEDDRLRERLFIKVAKQGKKGLNVHAFRRSIDRAVDGGGFVDYHSTYDYAQGIDDVVDSIAELLQEGLGTEVIEVSEYALRAVEESLHAIDDSDGYMGDILDRLQELHHQACQVAQPDPETLATRLFEWELRTDWDTFYGAAKIYGDVLGKKGLARYRMLADEHWAHVSPLKPGDPERSRPKIFHMPTIFCRSRNSINKPANMTSRWSGLNVESERFQIGQIRGCVHFWLKNTTGVIAMTMPSR